MQGGSAAPGLPRATADASGAGAAGWRTAGGAGIRADFQALKTRCNQLDAASAQRLYAQAFADIVGMIETAPFRPSRDTELHDALGLALDEDFGGLMKTEDQLIVLIEGLNQCWTKMNFVNQSVKVLKLIDRHPDERARPHLHTQLRSVVDHYHPRELPDYQPPSDCAVS